MLKKNIVYVPSVLLNRSNINVCTSAVCSNRSRTVYFVFFALCFSVFHYLFIHVMFATFYVYFMYDFIIIIIISMTASVLQQLD